MAIVFKDAFSFTRLSFWTGALLSSLIGGVLYIVTSRSIESDAQVRFVSHAKYAQSVIGVRIKSYTDLLRGAASVLQSIDTPTHRQFHEYVRGLALDKNFPALDNVNFAAYVTQQQRAAFVQNWETQMRDRAGEPVQMTISPPGTRPGYLLVTYIEPDPKRSGLYGIDLMTNHYFDKDLERSRDEGTLFAPGTPIQPLSKPNDAYLGMRMPVYRGVTTPETVEQRRAAYAGSIGIAFNVPRLLYGVMDEMPFANVRMTLFDTGPGIDPAGRDTSGQAVTLFDSHGNSADPTPDLDNGDDVFSTTLPLDFNGRPWKTVYSVRKDELYTEFDHTYPKLMMGFGFIGSILLYALLHTLTSSRRAALALAREMTRELRESQDKLQLSHQKLRRMADHAYQIKEQERKRIAREIHDDLGQNMLALRIEAEMLATRTKGTHSRLYQRARTTLQQIDTTIKSIRQIINDLRPTVLDLGLSAAVEWQANQFQRRTGIQCTVIDENGEISLPDHSATAYFRILQESLTNVVRHANATRVTVELRLDAGWLTLTVKDNGCGLPPSGRNKAGSFGLVGIEERIVILGGTSTVFSGPEGGTTVTVTAPMMRPAPSGLRPFDEHQPGSAVI